MLRPSIFVKTKSSGLFRRLFAACYNSTIGKIFLSQNLYPLYASKSVKIGLVAHEIFRKMGIEGDLYEVTRQMEITNEVTIYDKFIFSLNGDCSDIENLTFRFIGSSVYLGTDIEGRPLYAEVTLQLFSDHTYWMDYFEIALTGYSGGQQNFKVIFEKKLEGNWSAVGNYLFISDIGTGLPKKYIKGDGIYEDGVSFNFSKYINNKSLANKIVPFTFVFTNIGPKGISAKQYCPF